MRNFFVDKPEKIVYSLKLYDFGQWRDGMGGRYEKVLRLNALISETNAVYHDIAQCLGVSDSVMQILYVALGQGGSCTLREVCLLTGISKQTLSSALRKLEGENLVCLQAVDGKKKRICLTEKGTALAEVTAGRELDLEAAILEGWEPEAAASYLQLTERYLDGLRRGLQDLRQDRKGTHENENPTI